MVSWVRASSVAAVGGALIGACTGRGGDAGGSCESGFEPVGPAVTPVLVANEMTDATTIRLTFTEPMAPTDCVDPGKFRISVGMGYVPDAPISYYTDPAGFSDSCPPTEEPEECCYYVCGGSGECEEMCSGPGPILTHVIDVANDPNDERSLLLTLNQEINYYACEFTEAYAGYDGFDIGLFVHYSAGQIPRIQSKSGGDLEPIAEHWVLAEGEYYAEVYGPDLPNMDPPLPFTCP